MTKIVLLWPPCIMIGYLCGKYIENLFVAVLTSAILSSIICIMMSMQWN